MKSNMQISNYWSGFKTYKDRCETGNKKFDSYTGKAKDRVLVVLLSDLRETLPEYAIGPE